MRLLYLGVLFDRAIVDVLAMHYKEKARSEPDAY